jgi:hypothetical protein
LIGFQPAWSAFRIAPDQDTGMDLNEPWITALELFNAGKSFEDS